LGKHIFSTHSRPEEAVADRAYGTREVYRYLESMGILPTIPRRQTWQSLREKRLKAGFRYDEKRDVDIGKGEERNCTGSLVWRQQYYCK
jgi:hypothetical protein